MDELITPPAVPQKLTLGQKFTGMLFEPYKVFVAEEEKPSFLLPILMFLTNLPLTLAILPKLRGFLLYQLSQMPNLPPTVNLDQMISIQIVTSVIIAAIAPFFVWVVQAAVIHFVAHLFGDGKFNHMLAVAGLAYIASFVGGLVKTVLIMMTPAEKMTSVQTSLALLLPVSQAKTVLYQVLARFDPFTIWYLILLSIGVAAVYHVSAKKGAAIVFGLWVVFSAVTIALGQLAAGMIPGGM